MNIFDKIKQNFFRLNIAQQISVGVLVICVPVLVAVSVSAVTSSAAYMDAVANAPSESISSAISEESSEAASSSEEESSSEAESSSAQPIEIFLKSSSVEEDLEVQIVDKNGLMVTGFDFILTVKAKNTSYTSTWTVNDGFLRLTKLVAGDYIVTISDAEGYIITEKSVECTVKEKVKYEKVDVADKIKDETEIDVSKEDASLTKPVATPEPTPQLPAYKDKTATVTQKVSEYRYKAEISKGDFAEDDVGYLLNSDGSKSQYIAKIDKNGYIVGEIRVLNSSALAAKTDSQVSASNMSILAEDAVWDYSLRNLYRNSGYKIVPLTLTDSPVLLTESNSSQQESSSAIVEESSSAESASQPQPEICPDCGKEKTDSCSTAYCTLCAAHAGHTAADVHCSSCTKYGHADNTSTDCDNYVAPSSSSEVTSESSSASNSSSQSSSASTENSSSQDSSSNSSSASGSSSQSSSAAGSETISGSDSSSSDESSSETAPQKPSYDNTVKADVYNKNSGEIKKDVLKKLKITEDHKTTDVYKGGWNKDKTSYYLDDGTMVKGQAVIGGATYNFDSDGILVKNVAKGIDVSKYQPNVDWAKVKASGVDYVIIRVGYRGYGSGVMVEDPYFKSHIAGARAAGLKVGVYFYSQAITVEEAVEEASMAIQLCKNYKLHYPIYFDTEATGTGVGRADHLSKTQRTAITNAFCQTVRNSGYKAGVYASKSWFYYQLDYSQLSQYDIWLAHYTTSTDFAHRYDMWQYTGSGSCPGISGAVDLNWAYKVY